MRYIRYVVLAVLAIVMVTVAIANRGPLTLRLLPEEMEGLLGFSWQITLPAFVTLLLAVVFGVILGELSNYTDERDRHLIYIDGSLAAMSFCLAAEAQGLSTCLINWPDIEERERRMDRLLGTRPDQRVVMCFAVGYPDPDGLVPRSTKKPIELLRSFNESG